MFELRVWRLEDAYDLAEAMNNKKVQDNLRDGIPFPYGVEDAVNFITGMEKAPADEVFAFAVVIDGKASGSIGIFRQGNIHRQTAELGYYLAESYWGRGIMTAAIKEACERVFAATDILRIFAEPFSYNMASRRALEKAGFLHEGTLRKNAVKNGAVVDMEMYGLVR
jgi:RimJ/RimL family protein N-acetyltransferase